MIVLRIERASFALGADIVEPFSVELIGGARAVREFPNERAASIAARIAAGIVKPAGGTVFIGEYQTRIQPVQAKARVAFVPRDTSALSRGPFERELRFFADIFGIDRATAQRHAGAALSALGEDDYARAVALALIRDAPLLVLDRPPEHLYGAIAGYAEAAIFATRVAGPAPVRAREIGAAQALR
jgi:energy-coupling factor transporter ATP-binding protein EcfA2